MYTTIATREALKFLNIPDSLQGHKFKVSISPVNEAEEKDAFRRLKGIIGEPVSLEKVREERLHAYID